MITLDASELVVLYLAAFAVLIGAAWLLAGCAPKKLRGVAAAPSAIGCKSCGMAFQPAEGDREDFPSCPRCGCRVSAGRAAPGL